MSREDADLRRASAAPEDLEDLALDEDYSLNPDYVDMVIDAADRGDQDRLRELVGALHPADVADLMGFLAADYREEIIPCLEPEALAEILSELEDNLREQVLEATPAQALAKALGELDSDDAADVIDDMEDEQRKQVLAAMPAPERAAIETALAYEEESAGRLMQREVLCAPQSWNVGQTIDHIRKSGDDLPELFFEVYVVDPAHRPLGAVSASAVLRAKRDISLTEIMEPVSEIAVDMDQEEVAYIFDKYHLISAPVVDAGGRVVGQITVDDVVGVIHEEAEEDILALAGVSDAGRDAGVIGIVRARLPWLLVNLVTAAISASVIGAFQDEIVQMALLAVLMPIVASLGGNAATQTLAVAVRALAANELTAANALRIVGREMTVGLLNGLVVGAVMAGVVLVMFQNPLLASVSILALVANIFIGAAAGILAPLTLEKLGRDPAVSSSVFVTFVTDSMGFLCFLGLAALILI